MIVRDLMLVPEPSEETMAERRTRAYISQFAERTSPTRAIRQKCLECMGADLTLERLRVEMRRPSERLTSACHRLPALGLPLRKEHLDGE